METKNKIQTLAHALVQIKQWKSEGKKIVFTNGCFDIVHLGHIDYLEKARSLGDVLVLGVNTDSSVNRIKPNRPIIEQTSRFRLLAALAFIDLVIPFDAETPKDLITNILPDVLVKGNDYTVDQIVGAKEVLENGGEVKTIPLVEGYSTTKIINKILSSL
jgi:D-glycero-beta-D-manno-heptose 1-phosphate adenylyltransferase